MLALILKKHEMSNKYPETKQTFEALKNLGANTKFVSFENILNEIIRLRQSNNLEGNPKNLRGRVRRSLTNDEKTILINPSEQSRKLNIPLMFKGYKIESKFSILKNEKGIVKRTKDVEANSFKLLSKNSEIEENEFYFPNEINFKEEFKEGKSSQVLVNSYERNPLARMKCIEHYGLNCQICNFNFEEKYGKIGRDFIHVHHIVDISLIADEYSVNPISDLIPVCPNCHSMLHKSKPAYSIEEFKSKLKY